MGTVVTAFSIDVLDGEAPKRYEVQADEQQARHPPGLMCHPGMNARELLRRFPVLMRGAG